jgi:hypothetical protein
MVKLGGISYFAPRVGFVCDNVVNYEIVLASGKIINANEQENTDILVALRGGSNNFGVVVSYTIKTFKMGNMWGGINYYNLSTAPYQIQAFYDFNGNPNYDPDATVIQTFGFNGELGAACANNFEYTAPVANASAFDEFLKLPTLFTTQRISNLTDISIEQASFSPNGIR